MPRVFDKPDFQGAIDVLDININATLDFINATNAQMEQMQAAVAKAEGDVVSYTRAAEQLRTLAGLTPPAGTPEPDPIDIYKLPYKKGVH